MTVGTVLKELSAAFETGDYVKDQGTFAQYYPGYGWYGTFATVTTDSMFKVKKKTAATLTFTGTPTALPKTITLASGWNYAPCPHQTSKALTAGALPAVDFTTEDLIKSQTTFATYYDGYGWFGQMSSLEPGQGYMMKLAKGGSATFTA